MRLIFALCAAIVLVPGIAVWRAMRLPSHYGEFTNVPEAAVTDVVDRPKDFLGKTVLVDGIVTDQCKSMGCFFFLHSSKGRLRVELKDIAMHAPMHEGRPARVEGRIVPYSDGYQLYAAAVDFE